MSELAAQPLSGNDIAAFTLALIALLQGVLWVREREPGMSWLIIAFALASVLAFADPYLVPSGNRANASYSALMATSQACIAFGLTLYLRIGGQRRLQLLCVLTLPLLAQAGLAMWGYTFTRPWSALTFLAASTAFCVMAIVAARKEPTSALWGLALALGLAPALAVTLVLQRGDLAVLRHLVWPLYIAFGLMLLVVSMMRRRQAIARSQAHALRMAGFYEAMSRTSQAMVRAQDVQSLYRDICRICVETGLANMAYIGMPRDGQVSVVASAGATHELLRGLRIDLDPDSPYAQGPAATALREERRQICNDVLGEARTAPWHERARQTGALAQASFPVLRSGRVEAVLTVYMNQRGYFDDQTVALLDDMVGDISFAIDNLDVQAARAQAEREARHGYESFRQIFDAAPVLATLMRTDTRQVVLVNAAACAYYDYRPEEMLGRTVAELGVGLSNADRERLYAQVCREGRVRGSQVQLRSRHGEWRDFVLNWEKLAFDGNECLLALGFDVTEARAAERAEQARIAAEAASRAKTAFLSRISHELRTPLNAMLGFTQLLRDDAVDTLSQRQRQRTDVILDAGRHLLALVDDVLDVTRIEAGQMQLEARPVLLRDQIDRAVELCAPLARRCGVTLEFAHQDQPLRPVRADSLRLRQVLLNLVSNAIKYNRPGGHVRVEVLRAGEGMRIDVVDNGLGMTPEQLAHLYEPFNRLGREHGGIEGTGLGLALTLQLVELMHGRLSMDSVPGQGTRASLWLPLADGPVLELASRRMPLDATAEPEGTVLYIEDNPVNLLLVQQLMERWPAVRLLHAENGEEGLVRVRTSDRIDLLLLDMQLPDMDGIAVLHRLREDAKTCEVPVVVLSASAMETEVRKALEAGALDYWTKPLDFQQFLEGVRGYLARAAACDSDRVA